MDFTGEESVGDIARYGSRGGVFGDEMIVCCGKTEWVSSTLKKESVSVFEGKGFLGGASGPSRSLRSDVSSDSGGACGSLK